MKRAALLLSLLLAVGLAPMQGAVADQRGQAPATEPGRVLIPPTIAWKPCYPDSPESVEQCAVVKVPLDYDDPTGETAKLDLLKVPATDPAHRIGTLYVNPGGPGGSATFFASFFPELVSKAVTARYDIVGIDPRGVGVHTPMVCKSEDPRPRIDQPFPMSKSDARSFVKVARWAGAACRHDSSPIVNHMSTADTARDMDLIRQAVGDAKLNYYGVSYGTYLGQTYAAMFPDNVGHMIIDGVLDPIAWSTGRGDQAATQPFSMRLRSGYGAWQALTAGFAECDRVGKDRCPLAGHASQTWLDLVRKLRRGPVDIDGATMTYPQLISGTLGSLYSPRDYRSLMRSLKRLHKAVFAQGRFDPAWFDPEVIAKRTKRGRAIPGPYAYGGYGRLSDAFAGVSCADTDNPSDPWAWLPAGRRADKDAPWFSRLWTWASSPCAAWPAAAKADRFTGPFQVTTAKPLLIVGNTYDPATPLHGARRANTLFGGSRLLVLNGWGHGAIDSGPCINRAYKRYLIDGTLPPAGTVCEPKRELYP